MLMSVYLESFVCDEVDLPLSVVECATPNECIISIFTCDGVSDCSDGSDESTATCLGGKAFIHFLDIERCTLKVLYLKNIRVPCMLLLHNAY